MTAAIPTKGVARRRAKAIRNRENVSQIVEAIEDREFFETGRIPASATSASICCCGARSFSRGEADEAARDAARDWDDAHADCGAAS